MARKENPKELKVMWDAVTNADVDFFNSLDNSNLPVDLANAESDIKLAQEDLDAESRKVPKNKSSIKAVRTRLKEAKVDKAKLVRELKKTLAAASNRLDDIGEAFGTLYAAVETGDYVTNEA